MSARFVPPREPLVDPRTGLISRTWYLFFQGLMDPNAGGDAEYLALLTGNPAASGFDSVAAAGDQAALYAPPVGVPFQADDLPSSTPVVPAGADDLLAPPAQVPDAVPPTRQISTTAPLQGGGDLTADRTLSITAATASAAGSMSAMDKSKLDGIATGATASAGTVTSVSFVNANGVTGAITNPTTTPAITLSIDNASIANAKLANVATATFKGRATAGTGSPEDLTATQATALLNSFTSGLKGLVPASGGGATTYLRADGLFAAISDTDLAGAAWTEFVSSVTAVSGTFTAVSGRGRYKRIGKTVFVKIRISITNNGSAAVAVNATLPFPAATTTAGDYAILAGRETAVVGSILIGQVLAGTSTLVILTATNGYPGANGYELQLTGVYEAA